MDFSTSLADLRFWAVASPFVAYSVTHFLVLAFTALIAGGLVYRVRKKPQVGLRQDHGLALFLLLLYPISVIIGWRQGTLNQDNRLPCHLCDLAALCGAAALWFRHQRLTEILWFWGIAGTLNGLITPALSDSYPSPRFLSFFALHSGVVITAIYLVFGRQLYPQRGAVWRAFGWIQVYFAVAALVNYLTGSNYGFLRGKPDQASLLDFMGSWPWYLLSLEVLALLLFWILYLPFKRRAS